MRYALSVDMFRGEKKQMNWFDPHHSFDKWPSPQHRDIGLFTNASLYADALTLASESDHGLNEDIIKAELGPRRAGLAERRPIFDAEEGFISYRGISQRVARDLVKELIRFGWIRRPDRASTDTCFLTDDGDYALSLHRISSYEFRQTVAGKLQQLYSVPGWFIDRLWKINAEHQGEVFIPMPNKTWAPPAWKWENNDWRSEFEDLTLESLRRANKVLSDSLPVEETEWVSAVHKAWSRFSSLKRKEFHTREIIVDGFSPRQRLTMSMQEAAIALLFDPKPPHENDQDIHTRGTRKYIISEKSPRILRLWTARLEDLNMLFYTDNVRDAPGRLIFPVAVFLTGEPSADFVRQDGIVTPTGQHLYYHMPKWDQHSETFMATLHDVHWSVSRRVGSFYVSLLDVRDEVCRQLRISAAWFDELLRQAVSYCLVPNSLWALSIESDVREDQQSAHGLQRRPVWQSATPYSLIAIRKRTDSNQETNHV
jgi:hypothetical protein